jgi:hypothetical protein
MPYRRISSIKVIHVFSPFRGPVQSISSFCKPQCAFTIKSTFTIALLTRYDFCIADNSFVEPPCHVRNNVRQLQTAITRSAFLSSRKRYCNLQVSETVSNMTTQCYKAYVSNTDLPRNQLTNRAVVRGSSM